MCHHRVLAAALAVLAAPGFAGDKQYGAFVNAESGASLPAAFEILDETSLSYCFNDLDENCFTLPYTRAEDGTIEARFTRESTDAEGKPRRQTNIWTWTPAGDGYRGEFAIQYGDAEPELQTTGDFTPKPVE